MKIIIPEFLATNGITSTSANHLANIAKERIQDLEAELANIELFSTTVELINGEQKTLRTGYDQIGRIRTLIEVIARMYSFNAWVREAIRVKQELMDQVSDMTVTEYCKDNGIDYPTFPEATEVPTQASLLNAMPIKERNEYFTLEAYAATYGKHIHRDGDVSQARQRLMQVTKEPAVLKGQGSDAIIYNYAATVTTGDMDRVFFDLQSRYRDYEARLNAIKAEMADTIKRKTIEAKNRDTQLQEQYNADVQRLNTEFAKYQVETRNAIGKLKIVLPDKLRPIYDELNALGKVTTSD
ncbi:MAG: hypothetical protein IKQ89_08910 [Muribaculaceae bacterium]|jgi:hypothetical protein|nr:hypothetical protein [Muribaculaceae bacterium]